MLTRTACAATLLTAATLTGCTMGTDSGASSLASSSTAASSEQASPGSASSSAPASSSSATTSAPQANAKEVWAKAQTRVHGYTSLVVTGTDSADGVGPKVSFSGEVDGEPAETSYTGDSLGAFTMRHIGTFVYLKGDAAYWKSVAKDDPSLKGSTTAANRWIKMPASELTEDDLEDLSATSYIARIGDSSDTKWGHLGDGATLTATREGGRGAYKIVSRDGDTTVWVSDDERHDLLKVVDEAADTSDLGTATFSRWNEKIDIHAPAGAIDAGSDDASSSPDATT